MARAVVYEAQIPRRESPLDATTLAAVVESGRCVTVTVPSEAGHVLPLGAGLIATGGGLFLFYVGRPFLRGFGGPMEQLGRSAGEAAERAIRAAVSSVLGPLAEIQTSLRPASRESLSRATRTASNSYASPLMPALRLGHPGARGGGDFAPFSRYPCVKTADCCGLWRTARSGS
jgi:hypothetical protein